MPRSRNHNVSRGATIYISQVFQEIDQVKALEGCVKYADRVHNLKRLPQQINFAFQKALNGKPGPVYLDFPGDVLYQTVDESQALWLSLSLPPQANSVGIPQDGG